MRWQAASTFGWGLVGLNLLQNWARDPDIQPLMAVPVQPQDLPGVDPLRVAAMAPAAAASNQFMEELGQGKRDLRGDGVLVIDGLGNGLAPPAPQFAGLHNVGRCIFENTRLGDAGRELDKYDSLLCASEWAAGLLRAISNKPVVMIHEGIDPSLFFPGPRSGALDASRFRVFSGGKIEFRKAHDLVLLAFREFAARHEDAVLVAAWHSPWPDISAGFKGKLQFPLHTDTNGALEITRWAVENGIAARQFVELPAMPNPMLPLVLREMDCALQVSRCEACTNLPAKEAMACGVPVILANNTGTRDLVDADNCVALASPGPVQDEPGRGTDGWGETRVEDIVAALELLYSDTQRRKQIGARGAQWILERRRTWPDHAAALKAHLLGLF